MIKKKILIIEDEINIREVYAEVLKDAGYEVLQAGNGQEGYEKALSSDWDLMLLDIMLPKKDGFDLLTDVKNHEKLRTKPIVLLTNLGKDTIMKEGMSHGAASYLVKSEINPGDVVSTVDNLLSLNAQTN
ncbi:MAG: response regulator transcription factor [Patescibacteria group bacterium]